MEEMDLNTLEKIVGGANIQGVGEVSDTLLYALMNGIRQAKKNGKTLDEFRAEWNSEHSGEEAAEGIQTLITSLWNII